MARKKYEIRALRAISNGGLASGPLPSRIKLLDWGTNETIEGDVVLNDTSAKVFAKNQKKIGRERIPLDFDHCTVPGTEAYAASAGKPKAIAAYGTPSIIPGDGLWLEDMQWTPDGQKGARNYEDLSPTPILSDGTLIAIHSAALTPAGAVDGLHFYSAFDSMEKLGLQLAVDDRTALALLEQLEEHEEDEIEGESNICPDCGHGPGDCECEDQPEALSSDDHEGKYGDVNYADPGYRGGTQRYPIDTAKHIRAAWSYINMANNRKFYTGKQLGQITSRIKAAADKAGITISAKSAKPLSAGNSVPNADVPAELHYAGLRDTMNKTLAAFRAKMNLPDGTEDEQVLEALAAALEGKWEGITGGKAPLDEAAPGASIAHGATLFDEVGYAKVAETAMKPFSARLEKIEQLITTQAATNDETERAALLKRCSDEGKVLPLSAETRKTIALPTLREMVDALPKADVPTTSRVKVLSADSKAVGADGKPVIKGMALAASAIQNQVLPEMQRLGLVRN